MTGPAWRLALSTVAPVGEVRLRPIHRRDEPAWQLLRDANEDWLAPWEASSPYGEPPSTFANYVRDARSRARAGTLLPYVIEFDGELVGQLTVSGIAYGSSGNGSLGYWISRHVAGRGIMPVAVALAINHCLGPMGLHRIEVPIRPENAASLRVVAKLDLREEGLRRGYLHINGRWCDHRIFAITAEELGGGLLSRLS